jgi:hypothetical protein
LEPLLDAVHQFPQDLYADGTLLTGLMEASQDFISVKVLPAAIFLDDQGKGLFYPFIGGKPTRAMGTLPPPADHVPLFTQAGVNDPIIHMLAEGAAQSRLPFLH